MFGIKALAFYKKNYHIYNKIQEVSLISKLGILFKVKNYSIHYTEITIHHNTNYN